LIYDLAGELAVILITLWWLQKLGKRVAVGWRLACKTPAGSNLSEHYQIL
jgi:hypothetical protein